jgi:hypothetical protein
VSFLCHSLLFCSSYLCLLLLVINYRTGPIFVLAALCFVGKKVLKNFAVSVLTVFVPVFRSPVRLIDPPLGLLLGLSVLWHVLGMLVGCFVPAALCFVVKKGKSKFTR